MKAVRMASIPLAQRHLRLLVLLVIVSACQLSVEMYSFSERYRVYTQAQNGASGGGTATPDGAANSSAVPEMYKGEHVVTSKQYDDLIMMIGINVLVRVLFWVLLLRTAKKYLATLIAFRLADRDFEQGNRQPQAQPQAPMVLGVATPVATATAASHVV